MQPQNNLNGDPSPKLRSRVAWILALATLAIIVMTILVVREPQWMRANKQEVEDPWARMGGKAVLRKPHVDHAALLKGPFTDGSAVTQACLQCHPQSAKELMASVHWTWESKPQAMPGRADSVRIGKKHSFNNFCLGIRGNWASCTACHAGYGWKDASFDFSNPHAVDCLVCHDQSGQYLKGREGLPKPGVDLLASARSVGRPTRENCGSCHFSGGGGDAVKHGDLDPSLFHPSEALDVHMGKHGFQCVDCHTGNAHVVKGRSMSVTSDTLGRLSCTDCHIAKPHKDERIDLHAEAIACQTCHIPEMAYKHPTKTNWNWSDAGEDRAEDPHSYLKIKGSFAYEQNIVPEYRWYDGTAHNYIQGDSIPLDVGVLDINHPKGSRQNKHAKIWPFKVHRGDQPFDSVYRYLLQPMTSGKGGYWETFDWPSALRLGSEASGIPFSGKYGFVATEMYWPLSHMVQPGKRALQCLDCHGENGRMNWSKLGYAGDPMRGQGGRR